MSAEHYQRMVDAHLPSNFPRLGSEEARRAYLRICRAFGKWEYASCAALAYTTNTNMRPLHADRARRCWISSGITAGSNHFKGWGRLIHDVSHELHHYRHPGLRSHDPTHAKLEREVAQHVVAMGWLTPEGSLTPKPSARSKPTAGERTVEAIARWTTKLKRAENILRKLQSRRAAQLRRERQKATMQSTAEEAMPT